MSKDCRLSRNYRQTIYGSKDAVFELLCPERETEWLNGWSYKMIYSESGLAEKGCVFKTKNDFGSYQWVMTRYDHLEYVIQFVKFIPGEMIVIIDIGLSECDRQTTYCDITYTYTAIEDAYIEKMHNENTQDIFNGHMKLWEDSLNYYLQTGQLLK
ncbi:hypothetical protein EZV73_10900 [Acidaminobacter sp. JC074]|uniref:hypothetical protein n=1 Tax=Acidaminobacter sp. JC074 TaxID=2530199 RepID=UPI001F0F710D|nr:hypothetical protein [Acidaminobacter sp. JC074]MCH4888085.1 hypothetical protein [Acidaminobacter sp. JC074]